VLNRFKLLRKIGISWTVVYKTSPNLVPRASCLFANFYFDIYEDEAKRQKAVGTGLRYLRNQEWDFTKNLYMVRCESLGKNLRPIPWLIKC